MDRQTSGLLFSYYSKSQYHERCIPVKNRSAPEPVPAPTPQRDQSKPDPVTEERQWKLAVDNEWKAVNQWERNWGFLADYDTKGDLREKTPVPENLTRFSDVVPNTNAGNYGSRVGTDGGQRILTLEQKFYAEKRKKKMDRDIICY